MNQVVKLTNPFLEQMGMRIVRWTKGAADFEMPIQAWHMNSQGALQGGVVSTLVDAACCYAGLFAEPGAPTLHAVTITLSVSFVSSVNSGMLIASAKQVGGGRTIYFSEAQVRSEAGTLIASGQASFKYRTLRPA